jgi:hypothetical protein
MWETLHIAFWVFAVLYFSWCLAVLGRKLNGGNEWLAWVPVVNIFYMVHLAQRPLWFALLLFVPVVNLWALYAVWADIATRRGRPSWVGFLMLIPVINYMTMTNLALRDESLVG